MVGDTVTDDGETYEVVWSGGEGLIPDRLTKPSGFWSPPKRIYNKKSDYWTTPRGAPVDTSVDKADGIPDDPGSIQTEDNDGA